MILIEELRQLVAGIIRDLDQLYKKIKRYPLLSLLFIITVYLLIKVPHWQVSGIDNATIQATLENQNRATLAQVLGGVAIGIGLYYTWRRITIAEEGLKASQKNLEISKESQITERFTRAVDQLGAIDKFGNPAIEIRLGGIYALESIANESEKEPEKPEKYYWPEKKPEKPEKYYWPIMEILTAYTRKNSSFKSVENEEFASISMDIQANEATKRKIPEDQVSLDIQAILTVIKRRRFFFNFGEPTGLDLKKTQLRGADLSEAHLEGAYLSGANLSGAHLEGANLSGANLSGANLSGANLEVAYLKGAVLKGANLEGAYLSFATFSETDLSEAHLVGAHLKGANFSLAYLSGANLSGADLLLFEFTGAGLLLAGRIEADFIGANFSEADLSGADLSGVNLSGFDLSGADLSGANLYGTENLTLYKLSRVKTLFNVKNLDENIEQFLRGKYPALFEEPVE